MSKLMNNITLSMPSLQKLGLLVAPALCLALVINLSSCAPTVLVGGAVMGGAVVYDKRSLAEIIKDEQLEHQIQFRLNDDPRLAHTHINAYTFDGAVLLAGQVNSKRQRLIAEKIAAGFQRTRDIHNHLTLDRPTSMSTRAHDAWITTRIKSILIAHGGLKATRIKIVTENSVVFLFGSVTHHQAHIAIELARTVESVHKVVTLFHYPN